jgi:hypothetical protein
VSRLPASPTTLPDALDALVARLAEAWASSDVRPKIAADVAAHWDALIDQWVATKDLPLFVRRWGRGEARGQVIKHMTGRSLVPSDNTLANWVFIRSYAGEKPSIVDIRNLVKRREFPVALALKAAERPLAEFRGLRGGFENPNDLGWRVCHKHAVGIRQRGALRELPMAEIERHFRHFLSPSNMFLVPKAIAGLGELLHMCSIMKGRA